MTTTVLHTEDRGMTRLLELAPIRVVIGDIPQAALPAEVLAPAAAGERVVVSASYRLLAALAPELGLRVPESEPPLAVPSEREPLVADPVVRATGRRVLAGLELMADDLRPVEAEDPAAATVVLEAHGRAVGLEVPHGAGTVVVIGSAVAFTDQWIAGADNAAVVAALAGLTGAELDAAADAVRRTRPGASRPHATAPVVVAEDAADLLARVPTGLHFGHPDFLRATGHATRLLPGNVHDALVDLADAAPAAGAILIKGLPTGDVPATPASPTAPTTKDGVSEFVLLTAARRLGQPVGYLPEHGGDVVQNLVPTRAGADRQTSTSSAVTLAFHTETAFHPHAPRYLVLFCLRGDEGARTTLCSVSEVLEDLSLGARRVLSEPRFRTGIDESFVGSRSVRLGRTRPILSGDPSRPRLVLDADLMVGVDREAEDALDELRAAVEARHISVTLEAGDLLVVDNHVAVHGRSPYAPRFDGTDRWLQRTFVVADLSPSAGERDGRVITTRFAA